MLESIARLVASCSIRRILDAALEPSEPGCGAARLLPERARIIEGLSRRPARLDLTIRHFWPPDFRPPEAGFLASMLPWEHRAVPSAWVREIERWVDELWAPSRFRSGGVHRKRRKPGSRADNSAWFCAGGFQPAGEALASAPTAAAAHFCSSAEQSGARESTCCCRPTRTRSPPVTTSRSS